MESQSPVIEQIQREHFASKWTVALLMLCVLVVLMLFFPKDDLLRDIHSQQNPSIVTTEYLQDLLAIYPNDYRLRLLLAQEFIALSDLPKAQGELAAMGTIKDPSLEWRRQWLLYQLERAKILEIPEKTRARYIATKALINQMVRLADAPLTATELLMLANHSLQISEIGLTKKIYRRINSSFRGLSAEDYVQAAKIAIAVGDYRQSSQFYFYAQQRAPELVLKRRYFRNGVRALQQGNFVEEALREAQEQMANLDLDRESLLLIVRLALAANQPDLAQVYIQRALKLKRGSQ